MPDGSTVEGTTASYTPREEDVGSAIFRFVAYHENYPDKKQEVEFATTVKEYHFPTFTLKAYHKTAGIVPYPIMYAASANLLGFNGSLSYAWDLGDGTAIASKNKAIHTYTQPGNYIVTFTASDDRGNTQVLTDTVSVADPLPITIESIDVKGTNKYMRAPVVGIFKPKVSGGNTRTDPYRYFDWVVNGVAQPKRSSTLVYNFDEPGVYEVGLTVTTKNGLTGSGMVNVAIVPNTLPECSIEFTDVPTAKYSKLAPVCSDPDGRIRSYLWDLGNGQTFSSQNVTARYEESGNYSVTLTATDDSGGQTIVTREVSVTR